MILKYDRKIKKFINPKTGLPDTTNRLDFNKPIRIFTKSSSSDAPWRTFTSNAGFSVRLDDHETTTNFGEARERWVKKYNDQYGMYGHTIQAEDIVPSSYYAGQNKEFTGNKRLTPPSEEVKQLFSQDDIDYLEYQNGYNFKEDGPEETIKVTKKIDGLEYTTLEGPGAITIDEKQHNTFIKEILQQYEQNPNFLDDIKPIKNEPFIPNTSTLPEELRNAA